MSDSPNPRVPAGVSALIDVAAANVGLEVLVAAIAGTGEGAVAVGAGRVLPTVGQGHPGVPQVQEMIIFHKYSFKLILP